MAKADVLQLVTAHGLVRERSTTRAVALVAALVRRFGDRWFDSAAITGLAEQLAHTVETSQRQVATLTDAYLARIASEIAGRRLDPVGAVPVDELRAGTTHVGVYGRLADGYRFHLSQGLSEPAALTRTIERAQVIAETDLDLAHRAQAHRFAVVRNVDGYRRVIHPEVSKHGSCGLCIAASDRIYHRGDLMPIHGRCKCGVVPIIQGIDPGKPLNDDTLAQLYADAGGTAGGKLKRTRYVVHEHGELGPVLVDRRHRFRGASEVTADTAA